jgi:hypothetical protein
MYMYFSLNECYTISTTFFGFLVESNGPFLLFARILFSCRNSIVRLSLADTLYLSYKPAGFTIQAHKH